MTQGQALGFAPGGSHTTAHVSKQAQCDHDTQNVTSSQGMGASAVPSSLRAQRNLRLELPSLQGGCETMGAVALVVPTWEHPWELWDSLSPPGNTPRAVVTAAPPGQGQQSLLADDSQHKESEGNPSSICIPSSPVLFNFTLKCVP